LSAAHNSTIQCENPLFSEQNPKKIVEVVVDLIKQLDLKDLKSICTSGQMHDIILWDKTGDFLSDNWRCSNVVTWMDQRCNTDFLASLPE
jgi:sugar (pentulose or hexulose) kinase